jgi:hypothetical protein
VLVRVYQQRELLWLSHAVEVIVARTGDLTLTSPVRRNC